MTRSSDTGVAAAPTSHPAAGDAMAASAASTGPASPALSDTSTNSRVREQLEETRIDAALPDQPNGTATSAAAGEHSASGSESGRGRSGRKRSHDSLDDDDKPHEKKRESHARKKSRDVTSPNPDARSLANPTVASIDEHHGEATMTGTATHDRPTTPEAASDGMHVDASTVKSPQNKRTLEQAQGGDSAPGQTQPSAADAVPTETKPGERETKRQREKSTSDSAENTAFSNTTTASPFAALSSKPPPKPTDPQEKLPQTDPDKFKKSGFSSFASSGSPFGAAANTKSTSGFGAAAAPKLSSFASSSSTTAPTSGFASLGQASNKSVFGSSALSSSGTGFGSSLGQSAFGGLGGVKTGLSSFATPGTSAITGLSQKPAKPFGAAEESDDDEDEDEEGQNEAGDDDDNAKSRTAEHSKSFKVQESLETGEEGELSEWTGRAKLFSLTGESNQKGWIERGVGPLKLNIAKDDPKKARLILRADGTHRLLLNVAITKTFQFGTSEGKAPTDGKVLFNAPNLEGALEAYTMRMKTDKATELYEIINQVKTGLS